jgi:carboxylesterase type B
MKKTTGGFYNFSNIRYAAPPVGNLRFQPPSEPETNRTSIDQGTVGRICPQSTPRWVLESVEFVTNQTQGLPFSPMDPRVTEDCLFLDVVVSQKAFEGANYGSGAPVMLWIHGGGFTAGSKDLYGIPAGILARSEQFDSRGVVFVAINYRLGAFGFSAGSTIQSDGVSNAGLLDQRFALDWVQKHISKFGGDPQRVTLIGESAGGGSIMHQITVSLSPLLGG